MDHYKDKNMKAENKIEELQNDEIQEPENLLRKISELEDKILRILADSENLKKRALKENDDTAKYCISAFAKDVLTIRDNLKLALSNCNDQDSPIIDGIKLTMSEMDKILSKYGVKVIDALNKIFDPYLHQAMFEVPNGDVEPGTVVEIVQDGFMINDRLLRPSFVGVSKKAN